MDDITYELLALVGGRWESRCVYAAAEQRTAIADAKALEGNPDVRAVRVVKAFYDARAGINRAFTVHESVTRDAPPPPPPPASTGAPGGEAAAAPRAAAPSAFAWVRRAFAIFRGSSARRG